MLPLDDGGSCYIAKGVHIGWGGDVALSENGSGAILSSYLLYLIGCPVLLNLPLQCLS